MDGRRRRFRAGILTAIILVALFLLGARLLAFLSDQFPESTTPTIADESWSDRLLRRIEERLAPDS